MRLQQDLFLNKVTALFAILILLMSVVVVSSMGTCPGSRQPGGPRTGRHPRDRARRQPDHASPRARHRPDPAGLRAVRAGHRPGRPRPGDRARPVRPPGRARLRPAMHRRPRRRRHGRRHPRRGAAPARRASTLLVDVGTNAEIVLGNARPAARRVAARPAPRSRAPRSAAASGRRRARSSASASIRATLEPRFKVIGVDLWSDEPGFAARGRRQRASPASAARASSRSSPSCSSPASSPTDGVIDGALAARTPRVVADGRTFSYVLRERADGRPAHHR